MLLRVLTPLDSDPDGSPHKRHLGEGGCFPWGLGKLPGWERTHRYCCLFPLGLPSVLPHPRGLSWASQLQGPPERLCLAEMWKTVSVLGLGEIPLETGKNLKRCNYETNKASFLS